MNKIQYIVPVILLIASCAPGSQPSEEQSAEVIDTATLIQHGKEITGAAFTALSSNLMTAMQESGVRGAVGYCHTIAVPLVDSLTMVYNADIRRTSNRTRNPENEPTKAEAAILAEYAAELEDGRELSPTIRTLDNGAVGYYAPIIIGDVCLKCHGTIGGTILPEDYAVIKSLYPDDQATGYKKGELRGMWSVVFNYE